MGTDKRARQKANRQAKLAEQEAEEKTETREQNTRRFGLIGGVVLAIVLLVFLISQCGGDDESSGGEIAFAPTAVPEESDEAPVEASLSTEIPGDFEAFAGTGALADVEPAARNGAYSAGPEMSIDTSATYNVVINTDAGVLRGELFASEAPIAVNSFVALARDGYFDGLTFHQVDDSLVQGGDPLGDGTGGPGYSFEDEFGSGLLFDRAGLLAMANTGADTNGSQFVITLSPQPSLNDVHTIFGEIAEHTDESSDPVIEQIQAGTVITSVRIVES
ncbi:MAG: peptidylprolyl isomerase [Actinomycetota bacterium]